MIEHEIEVMSNGLHQVADLRYVESDIKDRSTHKSNIEKIYYFPQIDKVILYENNMKTVRVYDAVTMHIEKSI